MRWQLSSRIALHYPLPELEQAETRAILQRAAGCDGGSYRDDSQRDERSLPKLGYDDPATARVETAQREETGGGKREDARPGQHSRKPPDELRPDFGECCGALQ